MDRKHLNTLEFPQILARLAQHVSFSGGRELALSLQPSPIFAEVQQRLEETHEARYLLDAHGGVSLGGVYDVRPLAANAKRGAILPAADLLDIQSTLQAGRRAQRLLGRLRAQVPLLADVAARIEPCQALSDEIGRCISDQGEVVDHASEKLARIRREMHTAHERLVDKLNRILANPRNATYLQEALITQRAGRYVIPIKAEFKGRIPGIVHDTSSSGATLFIEPLSLVETGNRWRQLQIGEEKEVERILAELSAGVAELADEVTWTVEALADLDLALAKARYAHALEASQPMLVPFQASGSRSAALRAPELRHPGSALVLRQARHPLLDPAQVVPIDVYLGDDYFILVITGPNTGGKTVSLKTVGLMAAMAQSGLHLPVAEGSALSVFEGIYADIGDEQSIEQSLSTFSAHISNLIRILDLADPGSLVLVDELGAGTDPQEGSALARSILEEFLSRGITILVATHFPELKFYAHGTPGVRNASVEFDLDSLRPTYRLSIGLPGRSNALAIAKRLGLDEFIIDRARQWVSPEDLKTDSLLDEIFQQRDQAQQSRQEMEQARERVEGQEAELNARLGAIEEERREILEEAREEARNELEVLRDEMKALRRQLARAGEPLSQLDSIERELDAVGKHLQEPVEIKKPVQSSERPFKEGDRVYLRSIQSEGLITDLGEAQAEIQVGRLRVRANLHELAHARDAGKWESGDPGAARTKPAAQPLRSVPPLELDLRGMTSDEALDLLERHLDSAYLAGMPYVRIIHGKGTGRLREAIREFLQSNVYVSSFEAGQRSEGGEGATVVRIDVG
jgi:DNA mismatch repair protein MutS2